MIQKNDINNFRTKYENNKTNKIIKRKTQGATRKLN